jgi:hypothetical protein
LAPARALPIDEDPLSQDDEYAMPEDYKDALSYLKGVRNEQN